MVTEVNDVHSKKIAEGIDAIILGKSMLSRFLQPENAVIPIEVTLLGIVTEVNE